MPKIDLDSLEPTNRTGYPPPFNEPVAGRWQKPVGQAAGLKLLGARYAVLDPGAWSSQRHWHDGEDELLVMLTGRAVLIEDGGETEVGPGDILAWPPAPAMGRGELIKPRHAPPTRLPKARPAPCRSIRPRAPGRGRPSCKCRRSSARGRPR